MHWHFRNLHSGTSLGVVHRSCPQLESLIQKANAVIENKNKKMLLNINESSQREKN